MSLLYRHNSGGSLHQCGAREIRSKLKELPFSLLILAAKEFQPEDEFTEVDKILVPLTDSASLSRGKLQSTLKAAEKISDYAADKIELGCHVLSTCMAGWNRSGLISGLTLHKLTEADGDEIVNHIRRNRSIFALSNPLFARYIRNL